MEEYIKVFENARVYIKEMSESRPYKDKYNTEIQSAFENLTDMASLIIKGKVTKKLREYKNNWVFRIKETERYKNEAEIEEFNNTYGFNPDNNELKRKFIDADFYYTFNRYPLDDNERNTYVTDYGFELTELIKIK